MTDGKPLKGLWYDRSALDAKRRSWARKPVNSRGRRPNLMDVATWKPVPLSTPPMWRGLDPATVRERWRSLMASAADRYPTKTPVLGAVGVLEADPHDKPRRSKRSPAPRVHTRCKRLRQAWMEAYRAFVEAYRAAMEQLRTGWTGAGSRKRGADRRACRPDRAGSSTAAGLISAGCRCR